jgi:hypothetical protein
MQGRGCTALPCAAREPVAFGPEPAADLAPIGTDGPGRATLPTNPPDQTVNSCFLGLWQSWPPRVSMRFRVAFTAPGTYAHDCALHDERGMRGTVIMQPLDPQEE